MNLTKTIILQKEFEAESANISSTKWSLKNVKIIDSNGKILSENIDNFRI